MRVSLCFLVCCMLGLTMALPAYAAPPPPVLRIGLNKYFLGSPTMLLSSEGTWTLKDPATGKVYARADARTVYKVTPSATGITLTRADALADTDAQDADGPVAVTPQGTACVRVARLDPQGSSLQVRWHRYRGTLTVQKLPDGTLFPINTVPLEPYLYGVIPAEIGARVPLEAMRAQAVAARTYALKNRGKFAAFGYDLDDTTRSESYLGLDGETPLCTAAVDGTRGQVMVYQGQLIDAPYSTDSGGVTAPDTNGDCPYLQAVKDAPASGGADYNVDGKYHTWRVTLAPAQMSALLSKDPRTQVTQFVSLAIDGTDASGRITTATVAGADGTLKTVPGPTLRQILGYDNLRSTRVTLTITPGGSYQFDGHGWGHGLGMSQEGAVCMASAPYHKRYGDILHHYYVGVDIVPLSRVALPPPRTAAR